MSLRKRITDRLKEIPNNKSDRLLCMLLTAVMIIVLCITVIATTGSGLASDRTDFDKNTGRADYGDITVSYQLEQEQSLSISLALSEINEDGTPKLLGLQEGSDYIVGDTSVTLKKEYLETLEDGRQIFIFTNSDGTEQELVLNIMTTAEEIISEETETVLEDTMPDEEKETLPEGEGIAAEAEETATEEEESTSEEKTADVEEKLLSIAPMSEDLSTGSTNFTVDLHWVTSDTSQFYDMTWSGTSTTSQSLSYDLVINTNAAEYEVGQMEIRIPRTLWYYRDGTTAVVPSSYSISLAPGVSSNSPFNYTIDTATDEIVITNYRKVLSSSNYSLQVTYSVSPTLTVDMSKGTLQATAKATDNISGVEEAMTSPEISYTMNTSSKLTSLRKAFSTSMYFWNTTYTGTLTKPDDFDDYCWVVYQMTLNCTGNQPYRLLWTESPQSGGEIVNAITDTGKTLIIDTTTGTITSTTTYGQWITQYIYVLVRYPRTMVENGTTLINDVSVKLTGIDGIDDPDTLSASNSTTWKDYSFTYSGDVIGIKKYIGTINNIDTTSSNYLTLLQYGSQDDISINWAMNTTIQGYDYDSYGVELIDDFMDWKTDSGTYTQMQPEDYAHAQIVVSATNYQVDRTSGVLSYYTQGDTSAPVVEVWALRDGETDYELAGSELLSNMCYKNSTSYSLKSITVSLPENTYRVKVLINGGVEDYLQLRAAVTTKLKSNSPILQEWFAEEPELRSVRIQNYNAVKLYNEDGEWVRSASKSNYSDTTTDYGESVVQRDLDTYGNYIQRSTASNTITGLKGVSNATKVAANAVNDTEKGRASVEFGLSGYEYYEGLTLAEVNELLAAGFPNPSRNEAVFYDLLPVGMFYDEETGATVYDINGNTDTATVDVETEDDYRGSGRQMVIFRISTTTPGVNYTTSSTYRYFGTYGTSLSLNIQSGPCGVSGFSVKFKAIVPWNNIILANNGMNLMIYQVADSLRGDTGYVDDGAYSSDFSSIKGSDGNSVFYDLKGDGVDSTKDTLYSSVTVPIAVAVSMEEGLSKWVRSAEEGLYGNFSKETLAMVGSTYTYRLQLQNNDSGTVKDVVLFDILEDAADTTAGEENWKGSFENIDLRYAVYSGIKPVVYYSTVSNLSYTDIPDQSYTDVLAMLSDSSVWSTTMPADKSTITAIAVDLSKKADGTDFVFNPKQGTSVEIVMNAPDTMTEEKYAYNDSAYYSNFTPALGAGERSINYSARTTVELGYEPVLEKTADPAGGEDALTATEVQAGQIVTYNITYDPSCASSNIVIRDTIPEGMVLVQGSIQYTLPGGTQQTLDDTDAACYDPASKTITWPSYNQDMAGSATFTFRVMVDAVTDATGYRLYSNQATATVDGGEPESTNIVTHGQIKRSAGITKTAAVIDGISSKDADAATGGTAQTENRGTEAEPVNVELSQIVEYRLVVKNTGEGIKSGDIIVTDKLPEGTTLVLGSMTGVFRSSTNSTLEVGGSTATAAASVTTDGVQWVLNGMSDGEEAYLTFRVIAPAGTDITATEPYEAEKEFTNTAHLKDVAVSNIKYSKVIVYETDGTTKQYESGSHVYEETEYEKDSETTYHQVIEPLYEFTIIKQLTEASDEEEQFVFEISYIRPTGTEITFYQVLTVTAGSVSTQVKVTGLAPGTYTVKELESNWRYSIEGSATRSVTPDDVEETYEVSFTNKKTGNTWVGGKTSVTNIMPKLYEPQ